MYALKSVTCCKHALTQSGHVAINATNVSVRIEGMLRLSSEHRGSMSDVGRALRFAAVNKKVGARMMIQSQAEQAIVGVARSRKLKAPMNHADLTLFCLEMRERYPFRSRADSLAVIRTWVERYLDRRIPD
jgi:hypothetical protein